MVSHPFVIGELGCGSLRNRREILTLLDELPPSHVAEHEEVLTFLELHRLMGLGLGYVDVHLLAGARLTTARFWTLEERLADIEHRLGVDTAR